MKTTSCLLIVALLSWPVRAADLPVRYDVWRSDTNDLASASIVAAWLLPAAAATPRYGAPEGSATPGTADFRTPVSVAWLDCNTNLIPDLCDTDCGNQGEACDVSGCGMSEDCDTNGVPDECDPDADADGVIDGCDACPATIPGASVDAQGCPPVIPGDSDRDGDVDLLDVSRFQSCLFSSEPTGCTVVFDVNSDGFVDSADWAWLQPTIAGPDATPWGPPSGMALIPAGQFQMGDTFAEGDIYELPHAVYVDAFYMDVYEVTTEQYADALNWAKSQNNLITVTNGVVYKYNSGTSYPYCDTTTSRTDSRITWNSITFGVVAGKENHPVVLVSWYGAVAYANWRSAMQSKPLCYDLSTWTSNFGNGYRLPTEAEWEKAARGGVAGHRFPWSDTDYIQHTRANYYSWESDSNDTSPTRGYHPTFNTGVYPYTSPVGYFAANGFGLYDMAGNVCEWCNDWYGLTYYASSPYNNPTGPTSGTSRVGRGGSWLSDAISCRVADRQLYNSPRVRINCNGIRLALDSE